MKVLIAGLNSYLGRAGLRYFQENGHEVHGLVRDEALFRKTAEISLSCQLTSVDLLRPADDYLDIPLIEPDLCVYFTQVENPFDAIHLQCELLAIQHFVRLIQRHHIRRLIYVSRRCEKSFIGAVESLFRAHDIDFTVVIKGVAIGEGTAFGRLLKDLRTHKYVFMLNSLRKKNFSFFVLPDLYRWLATIPWDQAFVNEVVEFGGPKTLMFKDLFQSSFLQSKRVGGYWIVPLHTRAIVRLVYNIFYGVRLEPNIECLLTSHQDVKVNNSMWQKRFQFEFTPLEKSL